MKLVQLLAKELKEWPEGVGKAMQDFDMEIRFFDLAGEQMTLLDFYIDELASDACDESRFAGGGVEITKSQWQAEREKMNKPKWIRHRGGKCPVKAGTKVVTRYRDGVVSDWCMTRDQDTSEECLSDIWMHSGGETDIMAYYIEETKDQEIEEVKAIDTAKAPNIEYAFGDKDSDPKDLDWKQLGTITYKLEIDATGATQRIDSLVAKWGQIESPFKWRDAIIHCQAIIEDCEREIERNVSLLDAEGLMMQKDSKKAMQHYAPDVDMSDWRNWQAGDIVECINHKGWVDISEGSQYVLNNKDFFSFVDDDGENRSFNLEDMNQENVGSDFKFIRRP